MIWFAFLVEGVGQSRRFSPGILLEKRIFRIVGLIFGPVSQIVERYVFRRGPASIGEPTKIITIDGLDHSLFRAAAAERACEQEDN
jgi:hypothetical protein